MAEDIRAAAMEVVLAEERLRGNTADALPGTHLEKEYGCDILARVPGEEEPLPDRGKGLGEPIGRGARQIPLAA
jgi:hypothetical protein